ncbi:MAG: hypothetical protein ACE5JU_19570 [Candidatus Binatia bacterium]
MLGKWIAERYEIWQMRFLDANGLHTFSHDRGLMTFSFGKKISALWQLGWIRADLVESVEPLDMPGMILVEEEKNARLYADERVLSQRESGWVGALTDSKQILPEIKLHFHPFRYYVLYHIQRILELNITPFQMLYRAEHYSDLLERIIQLFRQWSSTPELPALIGKWNRTSELAILAEPCFYRRLFSVLKYSPPTGAEEQERRIELHRQDVARSFQELGLEKLEEYRQDLCVAVEHLDPNKDIHIILRLTRGEARILRTKGALGGSLTLLTMAEIIRRATEETFQTSLREEDELGYGHVPIGIKEKLYGAERILDADYAVKNQFLRQSGLDYGVRLRWYVEGDTECAAIEAVLGQFHAIELVNLRGQVVAKGGKGLAFRENLRTDMKSQVFSVVLVDSDRSEYYRAVRKAAEDDELCGMFFVSKPDLEFENFTVHEFEEILWEMITERGVDISREALRKVIEGAKTSEQLFAAIRQAFPEASSPTKGRAWGEKLVRFAFDHPEKIDEKTGESRKRLIVDAIEAAVRLVTSDYLTVRKEFKVDSQTGQPVRR